MFKYFNNVIIDVAYNGELAIEKAKKNSKEDDLKYVCIFMDINMPVMDGFEST